MKRSPFLLFGVALAIAVAGIASAPALRAGTPKEEITFAAFNLKNYLRMGRRVGGEYEENAPKPEQEIAAVVALLKPIEPDILGVCEIGNESDLADFASRLEKAGLAYAHVEHVRVGDGERCLALLSRFPVVATNHAVDLTYLVDERELPFQRGILDATVEVNPAYRLRLLGLHLKSKRPVPEADEALMRRNEARLLRTHVDRILDADREVNLLVYGDFNDTRNEAPVKAIQGRFGTDDYLRDLRLADADGYRWTYYWSYADQYSRFDFVFVNEALYPEINLDTSRIATSSDWFTASDHRPLVVELVPENREVK